MSELAARIASLSPAQRALFEAQLKKKGLLGWKTQGIARRAGDGPHPLSVDQERLWFLDQFEPGGYAYNISSAAYLEGALDLDVLERSVNHLVARHAALRTTFPSEHGVPRQHVARALRRTLPVINLRGVPEASRQHELHRRVEELAREPFDLAAGPLLRVDVLRLEEHKHAMLLTMHHIITDRWSYGILWRELTLVYDALSKGERPQLPELPIQFADYALWQRELVESGALDEQLSYWRRQLAGAPAALELPTDRPRPRLQTFHGRRQFWQPSAALADSLRALCQRENVTMFMAVLAAFNALLSRYTGAEDICVGSPFANRGQVETEGLIGYLLNVLVLRTDLSGDPTFSELLARARKVTLDAYANGEMPYGKLVEELAGGRDLSRNPLFQVGFVLVDFQDAMVNVPGFARRPLEVDTGASRFDLMLGLRDQADNLTAIFEYNTALFDDSTVARMMGHFQTLLEAVASDPGRRLSELPLLGAEERRELLVGWNDTARPLPPERRLHRLFESQTRATPDAVAVNGAGASVTYAELNRKANRIARRLCEEGVGAESLVGVCADRTPDLVAGLLGVLKAGGAYVPLDARYPRERLSYMLSDARVGLLLTEGALAGRLPAEGARVVCLEEFAGDGAESDAEDLRVEVEADNLAYVIYTSGSTGRPKGVQVTHGALVNFHSFMRETLRVGAGDTLPALASLSFDMSALELFLPLVSGATLHLLPAEDSLDVARLREKFGAPATVMEATPVTWEMLLRAGWRPAARQQLISGGEALHPGLAAELTKDGAALWNLYGPTEATVYSAFYKVDGARHPVPIGRPIANTQIYVVDRHMNPLPAGVPGELLIGGAGLARGYLRRPALTAERFVPDPFGAEAGTRLYRTGDLARYLPDGRLEFLGRLDHQVKLRGFRVELGEIEAALGEHPSVAEVVVVLREEGGGDKRLVAYFVAGAGLEPTGEELQGYLRGRLPDYMAPSAFVRLEALPLTPNGKLDRRALPAPDASRPRLREGFVPPRGPFEELLAGIWSDVLGVESPGARDNFFALGGHSLLATRVVSRVAGALGVDLPVSSLFESQTIAELAARVEAAAEAAPVEAAPLARRERGPVSPMSFAQQRLWFLDQLEPGSAFYNIPLAVRMRGQLKVRALEQALSEIVRRHEALRTTFRSEGGEPVQVVGAPYEVELQVEDLSGLGEEEREAMSRRLAAAEAWRPFDLSAGPLLRVRVLRLAEDEHVLLLTMHHIVSDGWSMEVLFKELTTLYEAFSEGKQSPLTELPAQYADYAAWQRNYLQGEMLERQLAYWRERLANPADALELPADHTRPAVPDYRGAGRTLVLPRETTRALKALARRESVTLFMTLLAAFKALLARYTGQHDIVVGTPVANRTIAGVEGLVGCFLNVLALRTDLSGDPAFVELLRRERETALAAYAHQDVPFELLLEALQPQRDLSRSPLFQVLFNMLEFEEPAAEQTGLVLEQLPLVHPPARFDLTFYARERGEELHLLAVYRADLFEPSTVETMLGHLRTLLEGVAADPARRLSELPLMGDAERARLRRGANAVSPPRPRVEFGRDETEQTIAARFERQAERHARRVAVRTKRHEWTYAELDAEAGRAAAAVVAACGEGSGRAALLFEHDAPMLAGVLGALKANKTYVPLDARRPPASLAQVLEDARPLVLLTDDANAPLAAELAGAGLPVVNVERPSHTSSSPCAFRRAATPDAPAYILYTSGSTGRPKGVVQSQRNVLGHIRNYTNGLRLGADDRLTLFSSYAFDASVMDIFGALLNGAALYPVDLRRDGFEGAREWLAAEKVTVFHSTPTVFRGFVGALDAGDRMPGVRLIVLGGEAAAGRDFELYKKHFSPACVFVNGLGPTESTLALQYFADRGTKVVRNTVPVGYAVEGVEALLLTRDGVQNAVFGVGEIALRSRHTAPGYWRRPALTAERFVPDPFSGEPGARLYRTGDLGRLLPDGEIEYLGRTDRQLKLRGFRVEPGEVEAALALHPAARDVAVLALPDERGEGRLVAFVVAAEEEWPGDAEWRAYLRRRLPDYMTPSAFVRLERMPLTPNGKADRRRLAELSAEPRAAVEGASRRALTPTEELIANAFAGLLGVERVGADDNFFALGGHSLLAMRLVTGMSKAFGVKVGLRKVFEEPTVAGLAEVVESELLEELERMSEAEAERQL
jgi:amino acid adenylation domain-containing protein